MLGRNALGAYLHGSAVLAELRPRSDIDVLVVSGSPITAEQRETLVQRLLAISGPGGPGRPRPVELTIVAHGEVRPWRYPPVADFLYGEWLRDEYERGILPSPAAPSPDLAPLLTMVLAGTEPLFGPPAQELLDPVPVDDLRRAVVEGIPGLLADLDPDTRNVVLTLARIWTTLATGTVRSKDAAADWALPRLPVEHRAVLARARAIYLGEEEERWDDVRPQVRAHVDHVLREIEQAR